MTDIAGVNNAAQRIKAVQYSSPSEERDNVAETRNEPSLESISKSAKTPWWYSQFNLMLMLFGLLGLAVVMFIALSPPPTTELNKLSNQTPVVNSSAASSADEVSPWNEARRAQARTDAQEILSNLLDNKKFLEDRQVENWAPTEFAQALLEAEQGDELYKEQDFQGALNIYQSAADKLDSLHEQIPTYVQAKLAEGQQAIDDGKSQLARTAFDAVLVIEPNNFAAMNGLSRAKILDQVLQLRQAAEVDKQLFIEQDDENLLTLAQQKLNEAISLDQQNTEIQDQLDIISELQRDKQYRDAMTQGFSALFANNYSAANNAFSAALKLNPDDKTASLAYQQSLAANKTSSLQSLLDRAKQLESSEDWQSALRNYQAVLSRDSNQVQAKLGEIRSNARYQLDAQLRSTLSDPLSLSKAAEKQTAQQLLADAKAIRAAGPKLNSQIEELQNILTQTEVTIKVQITSDAITEVTLGKEGSSQIQLGRFSSKNLALKPGRYVLSGVRFGFRDVRKEIELLPGDTGLQNFELSCDQPVSVTLQESG